MPKVDPVVQDFSLLKPGPSVKTDPWSSGGGTALPGLPRNNNFDFIRLIAALQVMLWHSYEHLNIRSPFLDGLMNIIKFFPGVPIFFTVSGFLIYASYDRKKDLKIYFRNRFLRIFPGLWACLALTLVSLGVFGYLNSTALQDRQVWLWIPSQFTFFQVFTPDVFRSFGAGSPNGSLWTIPTEVMFYTFVPVFFWFALKLKMNKTWLILILMALSYGYNIYCGLYRDEQGTTAVFKMMSKNLFPFLFYFLIGTLIYQHWERIKSWYEGRGLYWLAGYALYFSVFSLWLQYFEPGYYPNFFGLVSVIILSQVVIALAYSGRDISHKVLHGNDISYGVYLYHMPVINVFLETGFKGVNVTVLFVVLLTMALAFLSWKIVEQPSLRLKKKPAVIH